MRMTLDILQKIAKFLIDNDLFVNEKFKDNWCFYGSCVRKSILESSWNSEANIIQVSELSSEKINKICPKAYHKYTGSELGNLIVIDDEKIIVRRRYCYHNNKNKSKGFIGNDIFLKIDNDFINSGIPTYSDDPQLIITEEKMTKHIPENWENMGECFLDLYIDGYFFEEWPSSIYQEITNIFFSRFRDFDTRLSEILMYSILDKINYLNLIGIKDMFKSFKDNKDFIESNKFFDRNYTFNERIIPRILILYHFIDKINELPDLFRILGLTNSWKKLIEKMDRIIRRFKNLIGEHNIIVLGRNLVRLSNKLNLSDYEVEEYLFPVIHSIFKLSNDDVKFLLEFYEKVKPEEIKLPVTGEDIKNLVNNPMIISSIIEELTDAYDRDPKLTKKELLNMIVA